jgi:hypothetical protein
LPHTSGAPLIGGWANEESSDVVTWLSRARSRTTERNLAWLRWAAWRCRSARRPKPWASASISSRSTSCTLRVVRRGRGRLIPIAELQRWLEDPIHQTDDASRSVLWPERGHRHHASAREAPFAQRNSEELARSQVRVGPGSKRIGRRSHLRRVGLGLSV